MMKKKLDNFLSLLAQYENYFFFILTAINLIPLLIFESFPTVDGPAHLYNSRIIIELISEKNSALADYFSFNRNINPNWAGHFALSSLMIIFPALIAEKILIISYLIFFPLSFRFVFKKLKLKQSYLVFFIFPFTYSFLFYYGFYNFQIGLIFLFYAIGLWTSYLESGFNTKRVLLLLTLSLFTFFSHLFIFMILLCVIGFINLSPIAQIFSKKIKETKPIIDSLKFQLIILSPGILLMLIYLWTHPTIDGTPKFLSLGELWNMLFEVEPAKGISYGKERVFVKWIFILLALISTYLVIFDFKKSRKKLNKNAITWLGISISILIGFFILPNSTAGSVGFVSSRMLLFFFLFYIIFLGTQKVPIWLKTIVIIIVTYVNFSLFKIYIRETEKVNQIAHEIIEASFQIEPNSSVLPINDNNYWINGHISNYLGIDKPMIILENYEADLNHFPLIWNREVLPIFHLGDSINENEILYTKQSKYKRQIDYVFILTDNANNEMGINELKIKPQLDKYYDLIHQSIDNSIRLYKKVL